MKQVSLDTKYDKYLAYLSSRTWAQKRNEALDRDNYECSICHSPHNLEVHHLRYPDVLGTESIGDLMTLCKDCHQNLESWKKEHTPGKKMVKWHPPCVWLWVKFEKLESAENLKRYLPKEDEKGRDLYEGIGANRIIFYAEDAKKMGVVATCVSDYGIGWYEEYFDMCCCCVTKREYHPSI